MTISDKRLAEFDCGAPSCDDPVCLMSRELVAAREQKEKDNALLLKVGADMNILSAQLEEACAKLAGVEAARTQLEGWQPIETAPKDGSLFLIWPYDDEHATGLWRRGRLIIACCGQGVGADVTHWMPLPAPPQGDTKP